MPKPPSCPFTLAFGEAGIRFQFGENLFLEIGVSKTSVLAKILYSHGQNLQSRYRYSTLASNYLKSILREGN